MIKMTIAAAFAATTALSAAFCAESEYDFRRRLEVVHQADRRDLGARRAADEFAFTDGAAIVPVGGEPDGLIVRAAVDFQDYLRVSMKVDAIVRSGDSADGGYPESAFERCAPRAKIGGGWVSGRDGYRLRLEETPDGGIEVHVRTPDDRPVRFSTLDALGLSVYRTLTFDRSGKAYDKTINRVAPNHIVGEIAATSLPEGGYELVFVLSPESWGNDVRMKPGWLQLQTGDSIDQWDFAPVLPNRGISVPRLNLRHEACDFARIVR